MAPRAPLSPTPPRSTLSTLTLLTVTSACRLFLQHGTGSTTVRGLPHLLRALESRRGVLTVSNHQAIGEDPLIHGVMPKRTLLDDRTTRWTLGASDVIFRNAFLRKFFTLGQVLETFRGGGVDQPAIFRAAQLLDEGRWVHIFPEGRINPPPPGVTPSQHPLLPFRWGVGRILTLCSETPLVLPIHLSGFDKVFPEPRPYLFLPSLSARVSVTIGAPVQERRVEALLGAWRAAGRQEGEEERAVRTEVTALLREEVSALGRTVEARTEKEGCEWREEGDFDLRR